MHSEYITKIFPDSDLKELLEQSRNMLSITDSVIEVTPINHFPSPKQEVLRFLFMDARTASYDICVLAESLLNNENHHFSRAIEFSTRLLWEHAIDFFYIHESEDSVAERYLEFLLIANSIEESRKKKQIAFKQKYGDLGRDSWSGKTRKEKADQGLMLQPTFRKTKTDTNTLKSIFAHFNEHVHGNIIVGLYKSFDKHGEYEYEYRTQIVSGLFNLSHFYLLSTAYCRFTGRGSEVSRFSFYTQNVGELFNKIPQGDTQ